MKSRTKKILGLFALTFVLLLGYAAFLMRGIFMAQKVYDVVSIKQDAAYQDPTLLAAAYALPVAATYQKAGVVYQPNPSFCGPTSVANLVNSLGGAPIGPADVLKGSGKCLTGICMGGLTLDELAEVARYKTGKRVTVLRDLGLATLREHLKQSNDPAKRYIANFNRGPLFGKAGGHHSPIAGYLVDQDLVLVLDVNRNFQPWLVKSERLFAAIDTVDSDGGKKRGLLLVE